MEFFLTFCSAGRIKLKINTKKQNKISEKSGFSNRFDESQIKNDESRIQD